MLLIICGLLTIIITHYENHYHDFDPITNYKNNSSIIEIYRIPRTPISSIVFTESMREQDEDGKKERNYDITSIRKINKNSL
jgi:hypothetical protein